VAGKSPAAAAAARAPRPLGSETERTIIFDLAQLPGPLTLRRPRAGDLIYPVGMKGKKKLQDLFVDEKVPRPDRARAVVLDAGGNVAWVVGYRVDRRFLATDDTREALEVRAEEI
jgi:tRNA(Ile)-lysidine synthase